MQAAVFGWPDLLLITARGSHVIAIVRVMRGTAGGTADVLAKVLASKSCSIGGEVGCAYSVALLLVQTGMHSRCTWGHCRLLWASCPRKRLICIFQVVKQHFMQQARRSSELEGCACRARMFANLLTLLVTPSDERTASSLRIAGRVTTHLSTVSAELLVVCC